MDVIRLWFLLAYHFFAVAQPWDRKDFFEISSTYFKARHVKSVTVISCFGDHQENYWLMKSYLERGFYVKILFTLREFNASGPSNTGVLVDARCDEMVTKLVETKNINTYMLTNIYWLFLEAKPKSSEFLNNVTNSTMPSSLRVLYDKRFQNVDVLPMTHVAIGFLEERWQLFDVHKPYREASIMWQEITCCDQDLIDPKMMKCALWNVDKNQNKKRNLQGFAMPAATVITFPEYYSGLENRSDSIHDLFTKANYPLIKTLMYDLNFTLNMLQVNSGGWKVNGTFTGLMKLFQQRSVELGIMGALMRSDRMEVADYTIVTMLIKTCLIFKQPPLSLVSNIFELPFSSGVWLSCVAFVIFYWVSLVLFRPITKTEPFTVQESLYYMIGTLCQQNVELMAHFNSAKLIFFFAHLTSFFIFTSYSASIVALLQSPSRAINSVADLTDSPIKVGAMDTTYAYVYFNESKDPPVKELYQKKMKPFGEKAFTEADVGMKRVRDEFYAFSAESNAAYLLIKETFTPQDVCKIHELEAIKLPPFSIPMLKGSKYRELFRQRLIWLQEVGINRRYNLMWISQKPTCESGTATFTSVGLVELRYAYIFMVVGFGAAFMLLAWEIIWNKQRSKWLAEGKIKQLKQKPNIEKTSFTFLD